uniref:Uncharacterized protein n=1 Tax=Lotus japonicus TaxID=34305 RepID=I3S359_LOTJA|nr:unknown [Lotus japonicus]
MTLYPSCTATIWFEQQSVLDIARENIPHQIIENSILLNSSPNQWEINGPQQIFVPRASPSKTYLPTTAQRNA